YPSRRNPILGRDLPILHRKCAQTRSVGQVSILHSLTGFVRAPLGTATPLLPRARGARMNSVRTGTFRSFLLVAIASWVVDGHAWAQTMPSPVMPPATPQPAAEGGGAATAAVGVSGQVPTPELKDTVLRIVRDEAARIRSDVQIEDRLTVVPTMARVA